MEAAIVITLATVLLVFGLTVLTRWLVPKALAEDSHGEDHADHHQPPV